MAFRIAGTTPLPATGNLPQVGFVVSNKESRGSRLGREPGTPSSTRAPESTAPTTPTTPTTPTEPTTPVTPTKPVVPINVDPKTVTYQASDFYKDLSPTEAVGKATQLLSRAIGAGDITSQETYNKLFEPLYKDLQTGQDYGEDISRFYKNIETVFPGKKPYQFAGSKPVFREPTYGEFVNTAFKSTEYYDPLDFARRSLEAKAYYRPGGEATNLKEIGQITGRLAAGEGSFYGKGGTPYRGGYRTAEFADAKDPFAVYYNKYIAG